MRVGTSWSLLRCFQRHRLYLQYVLLCVYHYCTYWAAYCSDILTAISVRYLTITLSRYGVNVTVRNTTSHGITESLYHTFSKHHNN